MLTKTYFMMHPRHFSYNLQYKRYCYLAYGNTLAYDFNFTNNCTIFMKRSIL